MLSTLTANSSGADQTAWTQQVSHDGSQFWTIGSTLITHPLRNHRTHKCSLRLSDMHSISFLFFILQLKLNIPKENKTIATHLWRDVGFPVPWLFTARDLLEIHRILLITHVIYCWSLRAFWSLIDKHHFSLSYITSKGALQECATSLVKCLKSCTTGLWSRLKLACLDSLVISDISTMYYTCIIKMRCLDSRCVGWSASLFSYDTSSFYSDSVQTYVSG